MDSGKDRTEELRAEFEANEKAKARESKARAVHARTRADIARADAMNKRFHDMKAERQRMWEILGARDEDRDM